MKSNKGFTLIELLAVIVVLAVIALIATPIVLNLINDAKTGANVQTAEAYIKASETAAMTNMVKYTDFVLCNTYTVSGTTLTPTSDATAIDGTSTCTTSGEHSTLTVDVSGDTPSATDEGTTESPKYATITFSSTGAVSSVDNMSVKGTKVKYSTTKGAEEDTTK